MTSIDPEFSQKIQEWRARIRSGVEPSKEEMREYVERSRAARSKTPPVSGGSATRKKKPSINVDSMLDELDGL